VQARLQFCSLHQLQAADGPFAEIEQRTGDDERVIHDADLDPVLLASPLVNVRIVDNCLKHSRKSVRPLIVSNARKLQKPRNYLMEIEEAARD
jgi:hypothetical protein